MNRLLSLAVVTFAVVLATAACERPATRSADAGGSPPPQAPAASTPAEAPPAAGVSSAEAQPPAAAPAAAPARPAAQAAPAAAPARPEPTREPTPVPTPKPTPTPKPRIVPSGTALQIVLQETLTTKTAEPEDKVTAELAEDVVVDGETLLPAGAEVRGHVVTAQRSGRVSGRAHLVVAFDEVRVDNRSYVIQATGFDVTAGSSKGKDAKIAGGAAAAGAVIGAIAGGGSGALKGGVIGGAAGGAAVLATRGVEVELEKGTGYKITLQKSLRLR